jgi:putative heme transporter
VKRLILPSSVLSGVGFLLWRLPKVVGTSWAAVSGSLHALAARDLALLTIVWFVGLWCHSFVLTASLPGLSRIRALMLNLGGSAVCNLVPFGGVAGTAVSLAMVRSWRFSPARFTTFLTVSNLWNVFAKLGLPSLALAGLIAAGTLNSARLTVAAGGALVALLVVGVLIVAALSSDRLARAIGRGLDRLTGGRTSLVTALPAVRADIAGVARRGWFGLTAGVTSYVALQGLLWWMCLTMLGNHLSPTAGLAGFAVERVLSMLPISPGGAGFVEAGSIATLVSLGGDPLGVTAAVLLFRVFTFLLEIPVGGAALAGWLWTRRFA